MQPPPPPPRHGATSAPPPPMPPQLQAMMRQMQQRQPKFQQQQVPPAGPHQQHQGGFRDGRGRGRRGHGGRGRGGRGRGGFQQNFRQNRGPSNQQPQFKRKRGPSDDVQDASRFFLSSFLEDPWKELEAASGRGHGEHEAARETQYGARQQQREDMRPRQVQQYQTRDGPGRVFFQPSFLEDPWAQLAR
ncbi:hypothetical protein PHYPSEUDO_007212 [Phytophthora pseudosyringae]|uniref:M-phase-specific PLK1-interacting protein n=1 Tax=Phytophthora pseudosyringae TaxID=221518 RepID=A0A8T1VJT0_9STRA|nr:hypothetical protein PHYPSEUDO_007212 [Phytophthora pseudosyringae]